MTTDNIPVGAVSMPRYRQIRDQAECNSYTSAVAIKLLNGSLSAHEAIEAVLTDDCCGYETIPTSIGCSLIHRYPVEFAATIGNPLTFLERYFHPAIVRTYLLDEVFTVVLPDCASRKAFVEKYFVDHASVRDAMMLLGSGFDRLYVLDLVKRMIESETPPSNGNRLNATLLLESWYESPLHRLFSKSELLPILTAAIFKDPVTALAYRGNIYESVGLDSMTDLLSRAAPSLTNIDRVHDSALEWLPLDVQLSVLRNVLDAGNGPPSPEYLARLWLKKGLKQPDYGLLRLAFERITDLPVLYRAITRVCREAPENDPARRSLESLRDYRFKNQQEYMLGIVVVGTYKHPRRGEIRQCEVVIGNDRYIHDAQSSSLGRLPDERNYSPKHGDFVIFRRPAQPFYRGSDRKYWAIFRPTI